MGRVKMVPPISISQVNRKTVFCIWSRTNFSWVGAKRGHRCQLPPAPPWFMAPWSDSWWSEPLFVLKDCPCISSSALRLGSGFCQVHSAVKAMWSLKLTGLSPSSPQQLSYGYQNWESGDIINLNQSSGHARTLGYQDGDFCQPQLWKHRFTLDTRGSRSPFPLTSEEEDKPKLITKKQDSERGFLQLKESIPLS